uniref:Uncharacterized protein n=1 Tax=Rhizophora mucronata TaxID=61149 RepID=A0A2P2NSL2_RHIMU
MHRNGKLEDCEAKLINAALGKQKKT